MENFATAKKGDVQKANLEKSHHILLGSRSQLVRFLRAGKMQVVVPEGVVTGQQIQAWFPEFGGVGL